MCSRFVDRAPRAMVAALAMLALAACQRERRPFHDSPPEASVAAESAKATRSDSGVSRQGPYGENAYALNDGKRLFAVFNCMGCHSHGGGGMGPPLMDSAWIYGYEPANIYASIANGRPNGMPSFKNRIAPSQMWELVAYVRAMSGQGGKAARTNRNDEMEVRAAEAQTTTQKPVLVAPTPTVTPPAQEKPR
jgi:cytochrome c oxidase cbb3-type subunit III